MNRLIRLLLAVVIINSGAFEPVFGSEHEMGKSQITTGVTGDRANSQSDGVGLLSSKKAATVDEVYANGLTHFYDGDFRPALKIFKKLQAVEDDASLSYLAALCQYRLGEVASARAALVGLISKDPGHHAARKALVDLYADSGDLTAAVKQAQYLKDESVDEDHQILQDRLKLRIDQKQEKSFHRIFIEQGIRWNSNINAGSDKSEITAPSGRIIRVDEEDRAKGDWGATTHIYGWYRYDPTSSASVFWDTSGSLYHAHYFEHNEFNYSSLRFNTGPVWKRESYSIGLPAGYRASLGDGSMDTQEYFINPVFRYTFNKRWAIKSALFHGDRSYRDTADQASDKVIRRFELQPIFKLKKTLLSAAVGLLSASAHDSRLSYDGMEASLYARHKFTTRTTASVRLKHRIKNYQGIYSGWSEERQDAKNSIHASIDRKLGKHSSLGASISWSKNASNTELFDYEKYTAGLHFALKF